MTPGLEEELFAIDAKHVRAQADLVSASEFAVLSQLTRFVIRYKRVYLARGQMIQKALRLLSLTGSLRLMVF